ncbi:MAG: aldo/keto reductase [Myxococcaceae bacterium]|nr:aldo/keto reductase [Myxococcaceae bacterium]
MTRIGLGCGALGAVGELEGESLIKGALALGVTVFDSARSYGDSEARLGRWLAGSSATRSTKGGYGVEPVPEWTGEAVTAGIERARRALQVERIDLFFLHSCPRDVLGRPGLIEALLEARARGLVGEAGYSGDGEALAWAVDDGRFGVVQASFSVFDQANGPVLRRARAKGMRVLAKRALGGAVWMRAPNDEATRAYQHRFEAMRLELPLPWDEVATRFVAHAPEVEVALVGTTRLAHLERALQLAALGPLPGSLDQLVRSAFRHDAWPSMV